ncbi:MAG TPA: hypothetical protein VJ142_01730 [Candidatus Nanoarchaeia archaeon]|nr:hypothetical protein [Candidatus Nanoarchaeia archaeon]
MTARTRGRLHNGSGAQSAKLVYVIYRGQQGYLGISYKGEIYPQEDIPSRLVRIHPVNGNYLRILENPEVIEGIRRRVLGRRSLEHLLHLCIQSLKVSIRKDRLPMTKVA